VIEHPSTKHEALISNPSTIKKKKGREKEMSDITSETKYSMNTI
jgi:hypothetical protein